MCGEKALSLRNSMGKEESERKGQTEKFCPQCRRKEISKFLRFVNLLVSHYHLISLTILEKKKSSRDPESYPWIFQDFPGHFNLLKNNRQTQDYSSPTPRSMILKFMAITYQRNNPLNAFFDF